MNNNKRLAICLTAVSLTSSIATAGDWDIHGYGTFGAVYALESGAEYIRDIGQPHGVSEGEVSATVDSRFGLQFDYSHSNDLSFAVQALSKYQADATYTPEINWAFVKYTLAPGLDIRLGRTKLDFVFQAETINIGFPSLTARPPTSLYSLPLSPSDGFDVDYSVPYLDGYLTSSLSIGWATKDDVSITGTTFDVAGSPLFGGSVNYEAIDWSLKLSYGQLKPNGTPDPILGFIDFLGASSPELAESLILEDKWLKYYSLGGTLSRGNWRGVAAVSQYRSDTRVFPASSAQFVKLGYRLGKWTPFFAVAKRKAHDPLIILDTGTIVDPIANVVQLSFQMDQTNYSVGTRYDLTDKVALKAQYDLIDSDPRKTSLVRNEQDGWDGTMQLFTVVLDYYF